MVQCCRENSPTMMKKLSVLAFTAALLLPAANAQAASILIGGTNLALVYDPATNQITFTGATCDALKAGTAKEILISYGCPIVEPT